MSDLSTRTVVTEGTGASPARPVRRRRGTPAKVRAGLWTSYLILIGLALIYIYPFILSVAGSFKTDADATQNGLSLIPETVTFAAYERLFTDVPFPLWFGNTVLVSVIVTLGRVFFDSLA